MRENVDVMGDQRGGNNTLVRWADRDGKPTQAIVFLLFQCSSRYLIQLIILRIGLKVELGSLILTVVFCHHL